MRRSDGSTEFARSYAGHISAIHVRDREAIVVGSRDLGCALGDNTSVFSVVGRFDLHTLEETLGDGIGPRCVSGRRLDGVLLMSSSLAPNGDLVVGGLLFERGRSRIADAPVALPGPSDGEDLGSVVASMAPDLSIRWALGFRTLRDPASESLPVTRITQLAANDGLLAVGGTTSFGADFGLGPGFTEGNESPFVAGVDLATGQTRWSRVLSQTSYATIEALHVDGEARVRIAGRFGGPRFDLSDGSAPLTGEDAAFVATLSETGEHLCSVATIGNADAQPRLLTALSTASDREWTLIGQVEGEVEFGGRVLGEPGVRTLVMQRASLD